LFLPDPPKRSPSKWASHRLHNLICSELGVPRIEIELDPESDLGDRFQGVHTKLPGAELYAEAIVRGLQGLGDRQAVAAPAFAAAAALRPELHVTTLPAPSRATVNSIVLQVRPRAAGAYSFRIIQPHRIGLDSPVLEVTASGANTEGETLRSL